VSSLYKRLHKVPPDIKATENDWNNSDGDARPKTAVIEAKPKLNVSVLL
jgi:hypothetical protein